MASKVDSNDYKNVHNKLQIKEYIKATRPINLILVALAQLLIYHQVIGQPFKIAGLNPSLDERHMILFTFVTICIAAGGYLINDYFDKVSDNINNKKKLAQSKILPLYWLCVIAGGLNAVYIAFVVDRLPLFIIYPCAVLLLYGYARWWKASGFLGNLVVALFAAGVSAIILVAEPLLYNSQDMVISKAFHVIVAYSIFSFFINLIREIVKDMQDMEGDTQQGCATLPIKYGIRATTKMVTMITIIFIAILSLWLLKQDIFRDLRLYTLFVVFVIAPLCLSIFKLQKADNPYHYHYISTLYKWIMGVGLISIFIL